MTESMASPSPRRRLAAWALGVVVLLLALYAALGFLLLPWLAQRELPRLLGDKLNADVAIGSVRLNPFTLRLDAGALALNPRAAPGGGPVPALVVRQLSAQLDAGPLWRGTWSLGRLALDGVRVRAEIAADGRLNLLSLLPPAGPKPEPGAALKFALRDASVSDAWVVFIDHRPRQPARAELGPIDVHLSDFVTWPGTPARFRLGVALPQQGRLSSEGTFAQQPLRLQGQVQLTHLDAGLVWPFIGEQVPQLQAPKATLDVATRFDIAERDGRYPVLLDGTNLRLSDVQLRVREGDRSFAVAMKALAVSGRAQVDAGFALSGLAADLQSLSVRPADAAGSAPLALERLTVRDGDVDTARRHLHLGAVDAQGGLVRLARGADGTLSLLPQARPSKAPAQPASQPAPAWSWAVDDIGLRQWQFGWRDDGFAPPLQAGARLVEARLQGLDSRRREPAALRVQLSADAGGQLTLQSQLGLSPLRLDGQLAVDSLALAPLQPVLSRHAAVTLKSGALSGRLKLQFSMADAGPTIGARGELTLSPTLLAEAATGDRLLAWQGLQARGLVFDAAPAQPTRVAIGSIELLKPAAKLAISADRKVNVMQVLKPAGPATPATAGSTAGQPPLQLRIGRIALRGGVLDYADLSLVLPFATRIEQVDGAIVGMANDGQRRAQVEARGVIPPFGAASVKGGLLPFAPTEFMDLRVKMDNVAIPPLSPYTATFAGRTVKSGKLWLDLAYKIDHQQLLGDNQVRLADFTLGERVQSRGALDLPLDLAVALLTDENGRIELAVPVRGDVGRPSFELGPVIRQAVGDILGRIISAPFRALGRLFGGAGGEKQASILFEPGRAAVAPPEREKLQQLAQALAQRPGLQLVVPAPYAEVDRAALQQRALRRDLAQRLGQTLAPDAEPEPIDWASKRAQRALLSLQPPPAAGARPVVPPEGQDGAEAYRALFEQTAQRYPLADDAPRQLAQRRAAALRDDLVQQRGLAPQRLRLAEPAVAPLEDDAVAGRMAFDAAAAR
jgi:hypothetical protein